MDKVRWSVSLLLVTCLVSPTVQLATKEVCMIDLVIAVDRSGSIVDGELGHSEQDLQSVKSFLKTIISSYTISQEATKIALLTFESRVKVEFGFGDPDPPSRAFMEEKINNIKPGGHTATASALREARNMLTGAPGTREEASKVLLIMTDGLPTKNLAGLTIDDRDYDSDTEDMRNDFIKEALEQALMIRAETGAKILALGVTSRVNRADFLMNLADDNSYFQAEGFNQLMDKVTDIRDDSCRRVPAGSCTLDVVFAVDMSGSVGHDVYNLKNFLRSIIHELEAMDPRIHTALIRFANRARVFKPLDVYSPSVMDTVIDNLPGPGGYTATAHALWLARGIFSGTEGDRQGTGNVLVILSDGMPSLGLDGTRVETYHPWSRKQRLYQEVYDQADLLKQQHDVEIFSVVVDGKGVGNTDLLDEIASSSKSLRVHEFSELMKHISTIMQDICHDGEGMRRKRSLGTNYQGNDLGYVQ